MPLETVSTDVLAQAWSIAHRAATTAVRDHEAEDVAQDTVLVLTEQNLSELATGAAGSGRSHATEPWTWPADAATVSVTLTRVRAKLRDAFPSAELLGEPPRVYDID